MLSFEDLINEKKATSIKSGDVLFVEGTDTLMRKIIRFFSGSSFTHTAMLVKIDNSWFVLETRMQNKYNYNLMPVNWWFQRYPNEKTYIGKMPDKHSAPVDGHERVMKAALNPKQSVRPYKISLIAAIYILQKCFGFSRDSLKSYFRRKVKPLICSTLVQEAWENAGIIDKGDYKFPGDIVDVVGGEEALIPFSYHNIMDTIKSNVASQNDDCDDFQQAALNV